MCIFIVIDRYPRWKKTELGCTYQFNNVPVLVFVDVKKVVLSFLPVFTQFSSPAGFKNYLETTCRFPIVGNFKHDLK